MWTLVGFIVASAIGVATVLNTGRRGSIRRRDYPWMLDVVSQLHVTIVGTLAGFAFTGVVLVVTFAHDRPGRAEISLDTVVVMFLVSYLYWVGSAFLISYLPHASRSGDLVQRVHFSLASTIEYRTVFLSWFALLPLLEANGLARLVPVLYFLLPASLLLGSLLVAMATDGLGLMTLKEIYFSGAIGTALALSYGIVVAFALPEMRSAYSSLYLALVVFCVNGIGFALAAGTPLVSQYDGLRRFYERHGRKLIIADMQVTVVSLAFLWLAVVGVI
ncbi:MAG TPA: hypothetical protein VGI19_10825, partial [Candidatus Cybelea sp.]